VEPPLWQKVTNRQPTNHCGITGCFILKKKRVQTKSQIMIYISGKLTVVMENGPGLKMYFLLKVGGFPLLKVSLPEGHVGWMRLMKFLQ